jgi:predicted nucleic acid-binding Zn ribbon protein
MKSPAPLPPVGSARIRTPDPLLSPCPGCGGSLNGRKTVCSPRCRTRQWRRQRAGRDARLANLLREALRLLEGR